MNGFLALLITVDDQVEVVAVLRDQGNELLAFTVSFPEVIHKSQVAGGGEPVTGLGLCRLHHALEKLQKAQDRGLVNIKGIAIVCLGGRNVIEPQIFAADVAVSRRDLDLVPAILFTKDLYIGTVDQLGDDVEAGARAGPDIQVAALGGNSPGPAGILRFLLINGDGHRAFSYRDMQRRQKHGDQLRMLLQHFEQFLIHTCKQGGQDIGIKGKCIVFAGFRSICFLCVSHRFGGTGRRDGISTLSRRRLSRSAFSV